MSVDNVRYLLQLIARALAEYHKNGLVYGNLRPEDILVEKDSTGLVPRLSAFRFGLMAALNEKIVGSFLVNPRRLTYITPEQYEKEEISAKSDQYSLGLLAVEMLQGRPPVKVQHLEDLESKRKFFEDPESYTKDMCVRAPELSQIILKMLAHKSDSRWKSMDEIVKVLGPGISIENNNRALAKNSYMKIVYGKEKFFESFYVNLKSPTKFKHLNDLLNKKINNWTDQYAFLDSAICCLLNFNSECERNEPTTLS